MLDNEKYNHETRDEFITNEIANFDKTILTLFKVKDIEELIKKLKSLNKKLNDICSYPLKNEGAWSCKDCELNRNRLLCQKCWNKVKNFHNDHNIVYITKNNGFCNCGDQYSFEENNCPYHKAHLKTEKEIEDYINSCFDKKLINNFQEIFESLLENLSVYIINAENQNELDNKDFISNINLFFNSISIFCNNNALIHIICKLFFKNYTNKQTRHICLCIKDEKFEVVGGEIPLGEDEFNQHDCFCPFISLLISVWQNNNKNLLSQLLINFKMRKILGFLYFISFDKIFKYCINDFNEVNIKYIFCFDIANTHNLLSHYFDSIYEISSYVMEKNINFLKNNNTPIITKLNQLKRENEMNKYSILLDLWTVCLEDNKYLINVNNIENLGKNEHIYIKLLDLLSLFQNINSITSKYPHIFGGDDSKFCENLLKSEIKILNLFSLYVSFFDFDDHKMLLHILEYISNIIMFKKCKQLEKNEFSIHISLYRAFEIFLNRYCSYYANKYDTSIKDGFINLTKMIPNYIDCAKTIIKDVYKVFGFIAACGSNIFNYYGDLMTKNEDIYFLYEDFYLRDFALLKYFLSDNNFQNLFCIKTMFKLSSLDKSFNLLNDYFFNSKINSSTQKEIKNEDVHKFMKFFSKLFLIYLRIVRNNTFFIWELGSTYNYLNLQKIKDELLTDIIIKDKDNILEIAKELIFNRIITHQNLDTIKNVKDSVYYSIKKIIGEEQIGNLIISMTNKTLTQNKIAKFSIKDELLNLLDCIYIINSEDELNAEIYIKNFKKNKASIYNTYFYKETKYQLRLSKNIYENFFINKDNLVDICRMTELLLTDKNMIIFQPYFITKILKFWNTFFANEFITKNSIKLFLFDNINVIKKLIKLFGNNNINNPSLKSHFSSIIFEMKKFSDENLKLFDPDYVIPINDNLSKKFTLKVNLINKFKKKNLMLSYNYDTDSILQEKKEYTLCVYCLKPVEADNPKNLIGKLGKIRNENYLSKAFLQLIQKEFSIYNTEFNYKKLFKVNENEEFSWIHSCNHFIHFSCFEKLFNYILKHPETRTKNKCPLCKSKFDAFIPLINNYDNSYFLELLKGYKIINAYTIGKKVYEIYHQNEIKNNSYFISPMETLLTMYKKNMINGKLKDISEYLKCFEEEKRNINHFNFLMLSDETEIKEKKNIFEKIVFTCQFFVETVYNKTRINVEDIKFYEKFILMRNVFNFFSKTFRSFLNFFENLDDKINHLNYLINLILSIRTLIKINTFEIDYFYSRFYQIIEQIQLQKFERGLLHMLFFNKFNDLISELLFIICVLFDYENVKGYEKYILYLFLPFFGTEYYLKQLIIDNNFKYDKISIREKLNKKQLIQYLNNKKNKNLDNTLCFTAKQIYIANLLIRKTDTENIHEISNQDISFDLNYMFRELDLYSLQNLSYYKLLSELHILITNNKNYLFKIFGNNLKPESIFDLIIKNSLEQSKEIKETYLNSNLLTSCLPLLFKFIDLPLTAIELQLKYHEIPCCYCKKPGLISLICLTCGKKLCYSDECVYNGQISKFYHNKGCIGGRGIFLLTSNFKIVLMNSFKEYIKNIILYVDKFGQGIENDYTTKDYKLSKDEVNKALKFYINNPIPD